MTTIDELGARAAAAARADAVEIAAARVDTGIERLRRGETPIAPATKRRLTPRRWIAIATAATLAAAAVIAIAINANHAPTSRVVPSDSTQGTAGPISAVPTEPPTTSEAPAVVPDAIAVDGDTPPPAFPAQPFATVGAPIGQPGLPLVAIEDGVVVVTVDSDTSTATLIDLLSSDLPPRTVPLEAAVVGPIAAGPGDVLYGVAHSGTDTSIVAIALLGDRAGRVVASAPISTSAFTEAPVGVLGHGPNGIIDRRTGGQLIAYVDVAGGPTTMLGRPAHAVSITALDSLASDLGVYDPDTARSWRLRITPDPASASPDGSVSGAASSHGGAVVWTAVGPAERVVAVLAADGTGVWYSLTDGWQVAATDIDGTILARRTGATVELARLDPPQRYDFLAQPAAPHQRVQFSATLPTTLTSAEACTIDDLDVVPTADGAAGTVYGGLSVRNAGDAPCQVSGVPDVAYLDDNGNIVQSTDPALLSLTAAQAVVLERDSWAAALVGPITSNVCGGNESSQFRLTIGTQSTTVPFPVGGPFDSRQCDAGNDRPPVPGALAVEPFGPVTDNTAAIGHPFDNLEIAVEAPATVQAGGVLRYDVVMTVPADDRDSHVVATDICPIYTETLGAATGQYLLNCNGAQGILITPGESVRFHIELPIPGDATKGPSTLSWEPIEPSGPAATATITVL